MLLIVRLPTGASKQNPGRGRSDLDTTNALPPTIRALRFALTGLMLPVCPPDHTHQASPGVLQSDAPSFSILLHNLDTDRRHSLHPIPVDKYSQNRLSYLSPRRHP